jgi:LPS export ABC transporter permease LptF/LPS export ABC transporter permease LptG
MRSMKGLPSARPRILDAYIVREMLAPSGLGLLVFTFVLLIDQIPRLLGILVARSADLETIFKVFLCLLPSIFAVTIPMAFLLGVLLAFGRMASDSEIVALRAVGISPARLLVPVMMLAFATGLVTFYVNAVALPAANQAYRELVFSLVVSGARTKVKPRTFTDDLLPGRMMLYVSDIAADTGQWKNLLIYDTQEPREPKLILAKTGELVIDKARQNVRVVLGPGSQHSFFPVDPTAYNRTVFSDMGWNLPFDEFFPKRNTTLSRGDREMTLDELESQIRTLKAQGKPRRDWGRFAVEWHKKFAIPTACIVFGVLGLALSLGSKKEARSSAFALSIAVIFVYYILIRLGEQAGDTGVMSPWLSMWGANLILGAIGIALLWFSLREAAFDPLDPAHYLAWVPRVRRRAPPRPAARPEDETLAERAAARRPIRLWSLLDGYVVKSYVGQLTLTTAAFWSLTMLAEFMDLVDDVQQNHVAWSVLFKYLLFQSPDRLRLVLPVAFLVATLTTLGLMARRNEITAIKAGGISVYRLAVPIVTAATLGGLFLFGLGEFIVPYTNRVALREKDIVKGRPARSLFQTPDRMVLGANGRFYRLTSQGGAPDVLYNVWVYDVDPASWTLEQCLFASQARWNRYGGFYDLERGWRRMVAQGPVFKPFNATRTREIEPPEYFRQDEASGETLGFVELRDHIRTLASMGMDVIRLEVELHSKLALPAVAIVMALLGIPFAFIVGRRGALYGIGVALLLAIVYWSCVKIFEGLGVNALLAPALAMWAPNILFAGAAVYLLLCLDT